MGHPPHWPPSAFNLSVRRSARLHGSYLPVLIQTGDKAWWFGAQERETRPHSFHLQRRGRVPRDGEGFAPCHPGCPRWPALPPPTCSLTANVQVPGQTQGRGHPCLHGTPPGPPSCGTRTVGSHFHPLAPGWVPGLLPPLRCEPKCHVSLVSIEHLVTGMTPQAPTSLGHGGWRPGGGCSARPGRPGAAAGGPCPASGAWGRGGGRQPGLQ